MKIKEFNVLKVGDKVVIKAPEGLVPLPFKGKIVARLELKIEEGNKAKDESGNEVAKSGLAMEWQMKF